MSDGKLGDALNIMLLMERGMSEEWAKHFAGQWANKCAENKTLFMEHGIAMRMLRENTDTLNAVADERDALRLRLDRAMAVLEQCQDCIRGETPEDITDQEAREDTISKIREVLFSGPSHRVPVTTCSDVGKPHEHS